IAHITVDELRRKLTETEMGNGLANRFLWGCVQRSRLLARGGKYPTKALAPLVEKLKKAVHKAQSIGRMKQRSIAKLLWLKIYTELAEEEKSGLVGAITARAEAQVIRLACLYALLDQRDTVLPDHLRAALAVWRYCEASAAYIFGNTMGNMLADKILE